MAVLWLNIAQQTARHVSLLMFALPAKTGLPLETTGAVWRSVPTELTSTWALRVVSSVTLTAKPAKTETPACHVTLPITGR